MFRHDDKKLNANIFDKIKNKMHSYKCDYNF